MSTVGGRITLIWTKYTNSYPRFSQEEYESIKKMPDHVLDKLFATRSLSDFIKLFFKEFCWVFVLYLGVPLLIALYYWIFTDYEFTFFKLLDYLALFFLWLILGGIGSMYNFATAFLAYNRHNKRLKEEFKLFNSYDQYLYFTKFISIKY